MHAESQRTPSAPARAKPRPQPQNPDSASPSRFRPRFGEIVYTILRVSESNPLI